MKTTYSAVLLLSVCKKDIRFDEIRRKGIENSDGCSVKLIKSTEKGN